MPMMHSLAYGLVISLVAVTIAAWAIKLIWDSDDDNSWEQDYVTPDIEPPSNSPANDERPAHRQPNDLAA